MARVLANPFYVYIISFMIVLATYSLGWSDLYPPLSFMLIIFFAGTFLLSFFLGLIVESFKRIQYTTIPWRRSMKFWIVLIWCGYLAEFIYNKGVPLLLIINKNPDYDYRLFGIPTFHVLLTTLNGFLSVYIFHQLISNFKKVRLFYFVLSIIPALLIFNRGMFLMILTSCLFVYLLSLKRIKVINSSILILLMLIVFYFFGLLGNLRQTKGQTISSDVIIENSRASKTFRQSYVPDPYIWTYIYISSPVANFQNTINKASENDQWLSFVNYEILPDFISKRTGEKFHIINQRPFQIAEWLTVSTFYSRSYVAVGWLGVICMFIFFIVTTLLCVFIFKRSSKYYVTGLAILNTVVVYNTFDNMYAFTGLIFQLVYPLLFSLIDSLRLRRPFLYHGFNSGFN